MRIELYNPAFKTQWDALVRASKNGTFLFARDYMDYHRDRFADNSLLVFDDKEQLLALLPANKNGGELVSHGGLSYGGFITDERMKADAMLEIFERTLAYLKENDFSKLIYKCVPHIFHRAPAEEDLYALFRFSAELFRRDASSAIDLQNKIEYQERRRRSVKKASAKNVVCEISIDYESYWRILEENLRSAHDLKPVHSLAEIEVLRGAFPENIKLFAAFLDGEMVAGTLVYETPRVAHAQYIASTATGRAAGALDLLFHVLLAEIYREKSFFNFGVSTEDAGRILNSGLIDFKEGFGARAVVYDFYKLAVK